MPDYQNVAEKSKPILFYGLRRLSRIVGIQLNTVLEHVDDGCYLEANFGNNFMGFRLGLLSNRQEFI